MADTSLLFNIIGRDKTGPAFRSAADGANKLGGKMKAGLLKGAAALGVASFGAVALGKQMVSIASDTAEALSKTNVVFGKAADEAIKFAETSATTYGLSKREALKYVSGMGAVLVAMGDSQKAAAKTSLQYTKLAADMASFNNTSIEEAAAALTASLTGEFEQMKKYGVVINDAKLSTEALRLGIEKSGATWSAQQKKLLAHNIIMRETKLQQGDVARTADGLANKQKFLGSQIDDLKGKLGEKLLPVVSKVVGWLSDGISASDKLGKKFGPLASKVKDLGGAFGKIDLKAFSKKLAADAEGWADDIIGGVKRGFDTGDWSGLGGALGGGLAKALEASGNLALNLFVWVGEQIKKVNWVGLGVQMGRQVPSLMVGLAIGLSDFDIDGMFAGLKQHWQAALIGLITAVFLPLKAGGLIAKLLGKVPFVGPMTLWFLRSLQKVSTALLKGVGKLIGSFGTGMLAGFRRVFPQAGRGIERGAGDLIRALRSKAKNFRYEAWYWTQRILDGLRNAPSRLAKMGGQLVGGFLGGLVEEARKVATWASKWGGRIVNKLGDFSGLLWQKGWDFIAGFGKGIEAKARELPFGIGKVIGLAIDTVHKTGEFGSPSRLMMRYGRWFVEGFAIGMKDKSQDVIDKAVQLVDKLKEKLAEVKDFAKQIRDSFAAFSDVTSIDTLISGDNGDTEGGFAKLLADLQGRAADAQKFNSALAKLRKLGLNETTLSQLRDAGPESGLKSAEQILGAGAGGVGQVNAAVKSILASGSSLGNREAKALYGIDPSKPQKLKVTLGGDIKITADVGSFIKVLRKEIRAQGGDVQKVLGK